jgi:hypothetical protein
VITLTTEEAKARLAELEAKDELTPDEVEELADLKVQLGQDGGTPPASDGGTLNIGG